MEAESNGLQTVHLTNPPVNALSRALVDDLNRMCDQVGERVRIVVITAQGKNFCAGADLKEREKMSDEEVEQFVGYLSQTFQRVAEIPVPTVAAINGNCLGGGLELALACDMRIMADSGLIGLKETSIGVIPGAGGTVRLPRLIGEGRAKHWIFSADAFSAEEALVDGVVDWLVDSADLDNAVADIVEKVSSNAPLAIKASKRSINEGTGKSLKDALKIEQAAYKSIIETEDRREGLKAFRDKRRPEWRAE